MENSGIWQENGQKMEGYGDEDREKGMTMKSRIRVCQ